MGVTAAVHPTDQTLESYGLGRLDDAMAESVSKHLEACSDCRRRVAELSSDSFLARLKADQHQPDSVAPAGSSLAGVSEMGRELGSFAPPTQNSLLPRLADHADYQVLRQLGQGAALTRVVIAALALVIQIQPAISGSRLDSQPGIVQTEFIFEHAPFRECHASTIVETKSGLVAACFGGTKEANPDVGVWLSRRIDGAWTPPVEIANGAETEAPRRHCNKFHPGNRLQALGRTEQGRLFETWSDDGGISWGTLSLTTLPNNDSGTDAVTLRDQTHLIVYNHRTNDPGRTHADRTPLNVSLSNDGKTWQAALVLEVEPRMEFSYPAVIQAADGLVHITDTWKRQKIKHVVVDPSKLVLRDLVNGDWPR
jgi:anti-sigma factor RsiW